MKRTSLIFRHFIAFFATAFIRMDAAPADQNCLIKIWSDSTSSKFGDNMDLCNLYLDGCLSGQYCTFDDGTKVEIGYKYTIADGTERLAEEDNCVGNCDRNAYVFHNGCKIIQAASANISAKKTTDQQGRVTYSCVCDCPDEEKPSVLATNVCDKNSYGLPFYSGNGYEICNIADKNQIMEYGGIEYENGTRVQVKTAICKDNTYFTYDTLENRDACKECPSLSSQCPVDIENDPNGYQRFRCISDAYEYTDDCYECVDEHMTCDGSSNISCDAGYYLLYKDKSEPYICAACTGNAATCNADGAITCNAGYFPINKKCEECPDFATCKDDGTFTCDDGLHYKTDNGCDACPTGYATCSNDGFTCAADRYMMDGNSCPKCPDNATCTDNVGFTCNDGYWKSDDKCPQCTGADVATCDANGIITCTNGHFPNNNICQACPSNAECSNTEFVSCYTGFYGNQNGCQKCPSPGTSLFNGNTRITDCYVPIWNGEQRITYTDSIGTFYFGIKSGQTSSPSDTASHKTSD